MLLIDKFKNMKRQIFFISLFCLVIFIFASGTVLGQVAKILPTQEIEAIVQASNHTLQDYGLSESSVKYLTAQQLKDILNSKTPAETIADEKARIEISGTQQQKNAINNPQPLGSGLSDTVDCFDYYHFGSVQVNIASQDSNLNPGENVKFTGFIDNKNGYPIVSGTLYVKIMRQRGVVKDANGPDIVDQFIAADNIIIPANGEVPVSFAWDVPKSLTEGNYKIASFFIVDKKFNLLGLSFTNDVIGNTFNFNIVSKNGPQTRDVRFDEAGVKINDSPYFFAAFPPSVPSINPAIISAKINNSTNSAQTVDVVWKVYRWDGIDPANFIKTASSKTTIKAGSSGTVQITIPDADYPVYYIVGELAYKDSKSIIDVRFVRPEVNRIRLNFPSITSFPIKQGADSTIFSCLHNSGTASSVPNGKMTLTLTDNSGRTIDKYTYQGAVTGSMMAAKTDFVAKSNIDHFFLTAQLWQADKLVDQTKLEYDCNKIDPKLCNPKNNNSIIFAVLIIIIVLMCAAVIIFVRRKK